VQNACADDTGNAFSGLAIRRDARLAMTLRPTSAVHSCSFTGRRSRSSLSSRFCFCCCGGSAPPGVSSDVAGLSLVAIAANEATLLGGVRPFDAGNDGLVYDSWARCRTPATSSLARNR